jgi:hypothetical protein
VEDREAVSHFGPRGFGLLVGAKNGLLFIVFYDGASRIFPISLQQLLGGGIAKSVVVREFLGFLIIPPVAVLPFDLACDAKKGAEIVLGVIHFRIYRQSRNTYIEEVFAGVGVGKSKGETDQSPRGLKLLLSASFSQCSLSSSEISSGNSAVTIR